MYRGERYGSQQKGNRRIDFHGRQVQSQSLERVAIHGPADKRGEAEDDDNASAENRSSGRTYGGHNPPLTIGEVQGTPMHDNNMVGDRATTLGNCGWA